MSRSTKPEGQARENRAAAHAAHRAPGAMLEDFSARMRVHSDMITKMSAIAARAGEMMAARQAEAMTEAVDDLAKLIREAMSETGNPAAISRAHALYAETVFRRSLRHLQLSLESLAELSASALELTAPAGDGDPPPARP